MKLSNLESAFVWVYGDYSLKPFKMTPGQEIKIELEWNFTNEAHSNDWSIVAFGDGGKNSLTLKHMKGLRPDSFSHIKRQAPIVHPVKPAEPPVVETVE